MRTKKLRLIAFLCAIFMLIASLSACSTGEPPKKPSNTTTAPDNQDPGKDTGETGDAGDAGDTTGGEVETTIDETPFEPPVSDAPSDGYVFRMVYGADQQYLQHYGPVNDGEGDVIDLAFFRRNSYLEQLYGIEINLSKFSGTLQTQMAVYNTSNEDYADVVINGAGTMLKGSVPNGYLLNMANLDGLNIEATYWDQNIQKEYAIEGMFFALEGDYTIWDELRTQSVLYNAKLYDDYGYNETYGSPYAMVKAGNWTLDTMLKMFKDRSDLGNGQALTKESQWGMISESIFSYTVFMGTGVKTVTHDRNGNLSSTMENETTYQKVYNTLEYVLNSLATNKEILWADSSQGVLSGDSSIYWTEASEMFESDQALFRTTCLSDATYLDGMESDFGVLPIPKYEKKQDTYYSLCTTSAAPVALPATLLESDHLDFTVEILDAIGYTSKYMPNGTQTLLDAFYENLAVIKICRKPEDYEMMELIFAHKTYDLDSIFGLSGLYSTVNSITTTGTTGQLSSQLVNVSSSLDTNLTKLIDNTLAKTRNPS